MFRRKESFRTLVETICGEEYSVINLHGEKGIGKTCLGAQLREEFGPRQNYLCGYFDVQQYVGMAPESMVDALYDLCDLLTAENAVSLYQFDIADHIHSDRKQRVPYTDRKLLAHFDKVDEVTGFISEFIELPYIGVGLKVAKAVTRRVRRLRPQSEAGKALYESLNEKSNEELENYLPKALAMDANYSLDAGDKRVLILVENCQELPGDMEKWLYSLITEMKRTTWIFISRESMKLTGVPVKSVALEKMSEDEVLTYLEEEKGLTDPQERSWLTKLCDGNPLHLERAWEYLCQQKLRLGRIDWEELRSREYEYIATEALRGMSAERREMLFQLALSRSFDEELFSKLFPGRIFALQKEWFKSSVFTELVPEKRYCVQTAVKEEILRHADSLGITPYCCRNLFRVEEEWMRRALNSSACISPTEVGQHMQSFFQYGRGIGDLGRYFDSLMEIKPILINGGQMNSTYRELLRIAEEGEPTVRLSALKGAAELAVYLSDYERARQVIRTGLELARQRGDVESQLELIKAQMDLDHIAPEGDGNSAEECIRLANYYLDVLEKNIHLLPYKTYILNTVKGKLYLSKQYVIEEDFEAAQKELRYLFDLCEDPRRLSALSLYSSYGKAQEQMGEIYSALKDRQGALDMYRRALETYQVAEVLQPYWDSQFYLNFGLVHKRTAEGFFRLGQTGGAEGEAHIRTAIGHLESALEKYREVKERVPELIDTYCKMAFAYVDAAEYLWQDDRWNEVLEGHLLAAEGVLEEALMQIRGNADRQSKGNRQLHNSRCIITRTSGLYYDRRDMPEQAEQWFRRTLDAGDAAIEAASGHPYGYMEAANGHLQYARFLVKRGRGAEALEIARRGNGILAKAAERGVDGIETTQEIRSELEVLIARL